MVRSYEIRDSGLSNSWWDIFATLGASDKMFYISFYVDKNREIT